MAHLVCANHQKRVVVVENRHSDAYWKIADVFHRNVSGNDSVKCDSDYVIIDGESFLVDDVLSPDFGIGNFAEKYLAQKHDELIYS